MDRQSGEAGLAKSSAKGNRRLGFVHAAVINGVEAHTVTAEVTVANGLPGISIVGMPDIAVNEAKLRVRQALRSCGFNVPNMHIIVNLAPSALPKSGSGFDLPIAAGILMASGQIPANLLAGMLCVGELSLDGSVRPVKGLLAYEKLASDSGLVLLSAVVRRGVQFGDSSGHCCIESLNDLRDGAFKQPLPHHLAGQDSGVDYCDIAGNELAKRSLQIVAAGEHCLMMLGPPGSGKSMLAARLPTILPPLTVNQQREAAMIHSVAGLPYDNILRGEKPFRAPHHSASRAGLLGGGSPPAPGEVSLAHNGVLFLDEMPEFGSSILQLLRQPIESGTVSLARARGTTVFPAAFILIAAANPCPCGYFGDPEHQCKCGMAEVARYQSRIGGPLIDRFDMLIDVWRSKPGDVLATGSGLSSAQMRASVLSAREFRQWRLQCHSRQPSQPMAAELDQTMQAQAMAEQGKELAHGFGGEGYRLLQSCGLEAKERRCIEEAARKFELSGRGIMRALSVARTIADLEQSPKVSCDHLLEAITFRAESRASDASL